MNSEKVWCAAPAARILKSSGLLQGSGGKLSPNGAATRAEAAQLLMNFCENIVE